MSDTMQTTQNEQNVDTQPVADPTPNVSENSIQATSSVAAKETPAPVKVFGIALPEPIADVSRSFKRTTQRMRKATVKAMPAVIVNNSSNILGLAHVGTEMLMFKSNMPADQKLIQNPQNPFNWIYEPIVTVFKGVAQEATPKNVDYKKLFSAEGPAYLKDRVLDAEAAAARERASLESIARKEQRSFDAKNAHLANRWSMRSTFMGLIIWTLSAFIPEEKEKPEEIQRMAILRANNPVGYIGERLRQAVYFPEWNKHKRQMLGLGYVVIGMCSMLGSWRARTVNAHNQATYGFNRDYFITSSLSLLSSLPLLFAIDEKRGYSGFGTIMMGRIPFLFGSINRKYENVKKSQQKAFEAGDPNWKSAADVDGARDYTTASILFQVENSMQSLFGGAQKIKKTLPDGTVVEEIVDHQEELKEAKTKAALVKKQQKIEKILSKDDAEVAPAAEAIVAEIPSHTHHAEAEKPKPAHHSEAEPAEAPKHTHHAHAEHVAHHAEKPHHETPVPKIAGERQVKHAMPERVQEHHDRMAELAAAT